MTSTTTTVTTMSPRPLSLSELVTAYAETRDPAALERLRAAVASTPGFDPHADLETDGRRLLAAGDHAGLLTYLRGQMPAAFLSPSAHALLASAHAGLGDEVHATRERRTARLALDAILGSGDGTLEHPWRVLRVSDEYDVLAAQDRRSERQELVVRDGHTLDHHRCTDGSEAWFDITPVGG